MYLNTELKKYKELIMVAPELSIQIIYSENKRISSMHILYNEHKRAIMQVQVLH
jgi:hypothetical protein